jgi:hypothetical protein
MEKTNCECPNHDNDEDDDDHDHDDGDEDEDDDDDDDDHHVLQLLYSRNSRKPIFKMSVYSNTTFLPLNYNIEAALIHQQQSNFSCQPCHKSLVHK